MRAQHRGRLHEDFSGAGSLTLVRFNSPLIAGGKSAAPNKRAASYEMMSAR